MGLVVGCTWLLVVGAYQSRKRLLDELGAIRRGLGAVHEAVSEQTELLRLIAGNTDQENL